MIETKAKTVDEYIATFPIEVQHILNSIRKTIKKAAPKAHETISYGMPAFKIKKYIVYFAGYKKHIGFYPGTSCITKFKKEIALYKHAVGSVQFPLDKPIPYDLISKIVKFRVDEDSKLS